MWILSWIHQGSDSTYSDVDLVDELHQGRDYLSLEEEEDIDKK
jgi:hypothetical protein